MDQRFAGPPVVHATLFVVEASNEVPWTSWDVPMEAVSRFVVFGELVKEDLVRERINNDAADDEGPLRAIGGSAAKANGLNVKAPPLGQREGRSHPAGMLDIVPATNHDATLADWGVPPKLRRAPGNPGGLLLPDFPACRLFVNVSERFRVSTKKSCFPSPRGGELPPIGWGLSSPNIIDAVRGEGVKMGPRFSSTVDDRKIDWRRIMRVTGDEHVGSVVSVDPNDVVTAKLPEVVRRRGGSAPRIRRLGVGIGLVVQRRASIFQSLLRVGRFKHVVSPEGDVGSTSGNFERERRRVSVSHQGHQS